MDGCLVLQACIIELLNLFIVYFTSIIIYNLCFALLYYCNAPNCRRLDCSYPMTFHSTFPWSESFIGNLFRDLDNLFWLLLGSMIVPTNQLKTFQRALSSLTRFLGKLSEGHPTHNYSKSNTFTYGVFK